MTKVFVPAEQVNSNQVTIVGDDAHHLRNVLRKKVGDSLLIGIDTQTYHSTIVYLDQDRVVCQLLEPSGIQTESPLKTSLYQAVAKGDKMDLLSRKLLN